MKGLSLKNRFLLILGIILVILTICGLFLITMTSRLAELPIGIIEHPMKVSGAAASANTEVLRMRKDLGAMLFVDDIYELNVLTDQVRIAESKVYVNLDIIGYNLQDEEGRELLQEARQLFDEWRSFRMKIIVLLRAGRQVEAETFMRGEGDIHAQRLEQKLMDLNQLARIGVTVYEGNVRALDDQLKKAVISGILISFVTAAICIIWISVNVLGSIRRLKGQLRGMIQSGNYEEIQLEATLEMNELGHIFDELLSSLGDQLWVKKGNQQLYSLLNKNQNSSRIMDTYLSEMLAYGGFLSAAYYHMKEDRLELNGVVGRMAFMKDTYTYDDKVVGKCAKTNRVQVIPLDAVGLKEDEDISGETVTMIPVGDKIPVTGVLMLVSQEETNPREKEYLISAIKDLNAYIVSQDQRNRIDDLFLESVEANKMLKARQQELELSQAELMDQNNELRILRKTLEARFKDLEELTAYKNQFIANISHELKTPLNAIIILSDMLRLKISESFTEEDTDRILVIDKAAKELLRIINDILDLSRIERGVVEINEGVFNPEELMNQVSEIYGPIIGEKGLEYSFESTYKGFLFGDEEKVRHIISNFISNAVRFTEQGKIDVFFGSNEDEAYPLRIDIKDSGIGIAKDKQGLIFQEFVQSDGSINRKYGGSGLGLSICRNYADMIGGKIHLESALGKGSTFSLLLPECYLKRIEEDETLCLESESEYTVAIPLSEVIPDNIKGKRVLICDDEPLNVSVLSELLKEMGLLTIEALSPKEAFRIFREDVIDLVMMDLMMPEIDGMTAIKTMKAMKEWYEVPLVLITAADLSPDERTNIREEKCHLMRKPVNYKDLANLLIELLSPSAKETSGISEVRS